MTTVSQFINTRYAGVEPATLVFKTAGTVVVVKIAFDLLNDGFIIKRIRGAINRVIRVVAAPLIAAKLQEAAGSITFASYENEPVYDVLPTNPVSGTEIIKMSHELHNKLDCGYEDGGFSGTVYHGGAEHTELINKVMEIFQWTNPLHVDIHAAVRKMEAEVVAMVAKIYCGHLIDGEKACGALTSGGTESIGMAIKSYRDWGRAERGLSTVSIVMPQTAHPAFDKACNYYGINLIKVPVYAPDYTVNPEDMEKAIRFDTVALVASAPCFPYGTVDPLAAVGQLALKYGIGFHIDACLGSFVVPFMQKAGFSDFPTVDFTIDGVTTFSCDTHKYGFAPKGTSCVLYRAKRLRKFQFFTCVDWPGGIYCSPGASGSKAGNVIAGTWAAMLSIGETGYIESARDIATTVRKMAKGVKELPYLSIFGNPQACSFAFTSKSFDIYELNAELKERGWMLNPLQFPCGVQFSITRLQTPPGVAERFLADVKEIGDRLHAKAEARRNKGEKVDTGETSATMYGSQQRLHDRTLVGDMMKMFLDGYYGTEHSLNKKTAA